MKLLLLFGDAAVGKMTVGQELAKITDLKLFYNHLTIEPVIEIFGQYNGKVTERLRQVYFEEFAKTDNYGMIFTFLWALELKSDWDYVESVCDIFRKCNSKIYFAELIAPKEIRIKRNVSENRLKYKKSKRDIEASNDFLLNHNHRCVSFDGEIKYTNYIKIDNSYIRPEITAQMIKDKFLL